MVVPIAMSYLLDHLLLCKVDDMPTINLDGLRSGSAGLNGISLRGKVAVVLDGHRGLGYQVSR